MIILVNFINESTNIGSVILYRYSQVFVVQRIVDFPKSFRYCAFVFLKLYKLKPYLFGL